MPSWRSSNTKITPLMLSVALTVALTINNIASGQTAAAPAPAAVGVASAAADRNDYANVEDRARASRGGGVHRRDLSRQELVEAAARAGMEIVDSEDQDWVHAARRLAYEGSNCVNVQVTGSPDTTCDGTYYGEDNDVTTIRGPTVFADTCFAPHDCGDLTGLSRRMFLARSFRCTEDETSDCPRENVWGVYSSITDSTGVDRLGFLRAWADGALHPADVTSQWWTFQYITLEETEDDEPPDCVFDDCLLQVDSVTIECAADSPNYTLPPGSAPFPTPSPSATDSFPSAPTIAPNDATADGQGESNDASGGFPKAWLLRGVVGGVGGAWEGCVFAVLAGWVAVHAGAVAAA